MNLPRKVATAIALLTPQHPRHRPVTAGRTAEQPGPRAQARDARTPRERQGQGQYCKDESKKHVKGQEGPPFSQCVTTMAKLTNGKTKEPPHCMQRPQPQARRGRSASDALAALK